MAVASLPLTKQERKTRMEDYRQAMATVRLEGLQPGDEAKTIFQLYVGRQFRRLVPLSGHTDS